jgi:hypothetical protein
LKKKYNDEVDSMRALQEDEKAHRGERISDLESKNKHLEETFDIAK